MSGHVVPHKQVSLLGWKALVVPGDAPFSYWPTWSQKLPGKCFGMPADSLDSGSMLFQQESTEPLKTLPTEFISILEMHYQTNRRAFSFTSFIKGTHFFHTPWGFLFRSRSSGNLWPELEPWDLLSGPTQFTKIFHFHHFHYRATRKRWDSKGPLWSLQWRQVSSEIKA